jgi:hypothetical protein
MWDGSTYSVDRRNSPELLIHDAEQKNQFLLLYHLFVQYTSEILQAVPSKIMSFWQIGFFARCLICQPDSKQGYRQITNPVISSEYLPVNAG